MSKLTDNTLIPIGIVIALIGAVVIVVGNESRVEAKVQSVEQRVDRQGEFIGKMSAGDVEFKSEVIDRLARIETEVKQRNK